MTHLGFPSRHTLSHTTNFPLRCSLSDEKRLTALGYAETDPQGPNDIKGPGSLLSKSTLVSIESKLSSQRIVKEEER